MTAECLQHHLAVYSFLLFLFLSRVFLFSRSTTKTTQCASSLFNGEEAYFFFKFVQWKIKTKQFLAELRLLHPGVRFYRTAGLFLRRTS